ncbi:MAG: helix-turn-helix domain-containing protein [Clostridia bacterium]|nr:helix-turn-helix domain-containing protein [Clostridia bacterium]
MATATQCERVLKYINDFGSITQLDAIADLGVMRLASRISDLKKAGYPLTKTMESGRNRYGDKTCYARYSMGGQHG